MGEGVAPGHMSESRLTMLSQLSGCDYAMDDFVKVSGRRPDEGPAPGKSEKA